MEDAKISWMDLNLAYMKKIAASAFSADTAILLINRNSSISYIKIKTEISILLTKVHCE